MTRHRDAAASIELSHLSVHFRLTHRSVPTLKEWAIRKLQNRLKEQNFVALDDVSLIVEEGMSFGVIGANGAGKSTLLRVIAGIIEPSTGVAVIRGRVAPIIELGTGFDGELSARENVFFNGALLGRSRAEMRRRLDDILDFAMLEEFADAPLRTFSSGMTGRLAFAIATSVDADVLVLDEILSVGDQAFRSRCRSRIDQFRRQGATIVLVSHDLSTIERLCSQAAWLDGGRLRALGPASDVVRTYLRETRHGQDGAGRESESAHSRRGAPNADRVRRLVRQTDEKITRGEAAVLVVRARHGVFFAPPEAIGLFSDVPGDSHLAPYAEQLCRDQVTRVPGDGRFRPADVATRAELAVFASAAAGEIDDGVAPAVGVFTDVPGTHWAAAFIEHVYHRDAIPGRPDGTFGPDEPMAITDFATSVEHLAGLRAGSLLRPSSLDDEEE